MSVTEQVPVTIGYVGGPTVVIELGSLRLLTDPTFDPPGEYPANGAGLAKTGGPALDADRVGEVDAVLLSHDQHPDNLDAAGRRYLASARLVLSTHAAQGRLGGVTQGLSSWSHVDLPLRQGCLRVTGVPAFHGPDEILPMVGDVTGFVLSGADLPTIYISGDNVSLTVAHAVADRFGTIDLALLFAGGAKIPMVSDACLTMTAEQAVATARILRATHVLPLHFEQWSHLTEDADDLRGAFDRAGLGARLRLLRPGDRVRFSRNEYRAEPF